MSVSKLSINDTIQEVLMYLKNGNETRTLSRYLNDTGKKYTDNYQLIPIKHLTTDDLQDKVTASHYQV